MGTSVKTNESAALQVEVLAAKAPGAGGGGGGGGGGNGGGGGGGNGGGGGGGGGGRPITGDLYGDQYILLRDLDPADGGGDGEPVLDDNGQPILIGSDGRLIYYVADAEGDYEIPLDDLPYAQTVELERANVARAPDKVMAKSLTEALAKIEAAISVTTDTAGRIVCDGATIDSPLENLALYQYLMTAGGLSSWPEVVGAWDESFKKLLDLGFDGNGQGPGGLDPDALLNPSWDPSSLLGAAFSKESPITMDAVLYENSVLGVNDVTTSTDGETVIDYFRFSVDSDPDDQGPRTTETYNYDRDARFDGVWIQWYENMDEDPELELVTDTVLNAVFASPVWLDEYMNAPADLGGINDFAQAADDARAVINFMHEHFGAIEIPAPLSGEPSVMDVPVELVGVSLSANGMCAADCPMV